MQFDYLDWFYTYGIYTIMIIGTSIVAILVRYFAKAQYRKMDDSDKLESPTFEKQESGIIITDPDDDEDDP